MDTMLAPPIAPVDRHGSSRHRLRVGDFVAVTLGGPNVCVVEAVEENDLIRVRQMGWPQGYTAVADVRDIRYLGWLLNSEP